MDIDMATTSEIIATPNMYRCDDKALTTSTLSPTKGEDVGGTEEIVISYFGPLGLPDDLVEAILLKQDAKSEAVLKSVCRRFNLIMRTSHWTLARQKVTGEQEPEYYSVYLSIDKDLSSVGWDLESQEWVSLPSLAFLLEVTAEESTSKKKSDVTIERVHCSENGLMCVEIIYDNDRIIPSLSGVLSYLPYERATYVCNPLTKSYIRIAQHPVEQLRTVMHWLSLMMLHARDGESGFTIYQVMFKTTHVYDDSSIDLELWMWKLDNKNLEAGWQELELFTVDDVDDVTPFVLFDGVMYAIVNRIHNRSHPLLISYHIDKGLWKSHDIPGSTPIDHRDQQLVDVGGSLWMVAISDIDISAIHIFRYDPQQSNFIPVSMKYVRIGDPWSRDIATFGKSKILFMKETSPDTGPYIALEYDIFTNEWLECDECPPLKAPISGYCFHLGGFKLSHASLM